MPGRIDDGPQDRRDERSGPDAFLAARSEIDRFLAELAALSADHFHASPDEITWGHVGSANHIRERLQEIASFAAGKG